MGKPAVEYSCRGCVPDVDVLRLFLTSDEFSARELDTYKTWSAVVILSSTLVMDKGGPSLKNRVILRPVPSPNSSSRLALPGLTPASPVQKPPPSQSSMPPRSQSFPTGRSQKALIATGKAVVVVDWICIDEPSVRSKVAATSDSGSETPVE
ncbi:hypothetical protein BU17DRAFT_60069 [Hysterangium stoloniferum]|nr:hypothetical protein BU17DRAFT_60069 [Hysterangium stoloniferum]